ncbi:terpene synthase family protein [Kitasatospora sp. NPDC089509]|uniref:terpene synthase family protein n=1 Tax=Kitasatospora sp. NPDC089509 TaxID=3364079 RepID=UPI003830B9E6
MTTAVPVPRWAAEADAHTLEWCTRHGLLSGPDPAERFRLARFGTLAARTHPEASQESLPVLADWFAWAFVLDDHLDTGAHVPGQAGTPGVRRTSRLLAEFAAIVEGHAAVHGHAPVRLQPMTRALDDLWRRTSATMTAAVRHRTVRHLREYLDALAMESGQRRRGRIPTLPEYVALRRVTGGVREDLDFADHLAGRSLPDGLFEHPWHLDLLAAAGDVVNWTNDLASWRKEQACGEVHNLVLVLAHHTGRPPEEAAALVRNRIAERRDRFEGLTGHPPHPLLARRATALRQWADGFQAWLADTDRYRAPAG